MLNNTIFYFEKMEMTHYKVQYYKFDSYHSRHSFILCPFGGPHALRTTNCVQLYPQGFLITSILNTLSILKYFFQVLNLQDLLRYM